METLNEGSFKISIDVVQVLKAQSVDGGQRSSEVVSAYFFCAEVEVCF